MTTTPDRADRLAQIVEMRQRAAEAAEHLRATCVAAVAAGDPIRQVAIAADVTRDTIYRWRLLARSM